MWNHLMCTFRHRILLWFTVCHWCLQDPFTSSGIQIQVVFIPPFKTILPGFCKDIRKHNVAFLPVSPVCSLLSCDLVISACALQRKNWRRQILENAFLWRLALRKKSSPIYWCEDYSWDFPSSPLSLLLLCYWYRTARQGRRTERISIRWGFQK